MTARALLLEAAEHFERDCPLQYYERDRYNRRAAALRELASRMDHEERWAKDIEASPLRDPHTKHAAIIVQGVLARLDADLGSPTPTKEGE